MSFDVAAARAEFPILKRQVNGHPLVYLDNAASAQKPAAVIAAMTAAMETSYANVHRGLHTLANETTEAYETAREAARGLLGAASAGEIVFTKGATEAINLVASSLGAGFEPGDEIVLTEMEHHANIVPWHFLRERAGAVLKFAPISDEGVLDLEALRALIGPRTRIVAASHMSNVLGTINPVREIIAAAHAGGALALLDGCQAVVHGKVDVTDLDADFYVFSGHKLYGPSGIGVLYGKAELLAALPPYQGGGEMIDTVTLEEITFADPPHRFEAGTPPILEAIGLGAAIAWLEGLDREAIAAHEHALYARVKEGLNGANWLTEMGRAPGKGAIFAFNMEGAHAHDVAQVLDR
ncbi:MAG TPA: cysteine desulfurase, partial [Caulobacteraceae bacterium]